MMLIWNLFRTIRIFFKGGSDIFVNIAHWQQPLAIEIGQGDKMNLKRLGFAELYKISTESKVGTEKIKSKSYFA